MITANIVISVDGIPLTFLGRTVYYGGLELTHRFPWGSWQARWQMDLPPSFRHPALKRGAETVVYIGSTRVFRGQMSELNYDSGEFIAAGSAREGESALAFNLVNATTDVDEAIYFAAARGLLHWGTLHNFGPPLNAEGYTDKPNRVFDLVNGWATQNNANVVVDPEGLLYTVPTPTTASVVISPGIAQMGVADEDYWTQLTGVFTPTGGEYVLISTPPDTSQDVGRRERAVDLTGLGYVPQATAQTTLNNIFAQGLARTGWTNSIEVGPSQISAAGGTLLQPWTIAAQMARGGVMARVMGLIDPRGSAMSTDVILEETVFKASGNTIELKPRGLADRDLASIVESAGGVLAA